MTEASSEGQIDFRIVPATESDTFRLSIVSLVRTIHDRSLQYNKAKEVRHLVQQYIYQSSSRVNTFITLQAALSDETDIRTVVQSIQKHLTPQWSDGDYFTREIVTIELLRKLSFALSINQSRTLLLICAQSPKLISQLESFLRVICYLDLVVGAQLRLAKSVQEWLNCVVLTNSDTDGIDSIITLQRKYLSAWTEIDDLRYIRRPRVSRREPSNRAVPDFRPRNVYLPPEEVETHLSDANCLCFDILRMKLENDPCNHAILELSLSRAAKMQARLNSYSNLQVHLEESDYEQTLKGLVVDTIQRLSYCTSMDQQVVGDVLRPPRYYYHRLKS